MAFFMYLVLYFYTFTRGGEVCPIAVKLRFPSTVGAECFRPDTSTNTPFGVLSGGFNPPLRWITALLVMLMEVCRRSRP